MTEIYIFLGVLVIVALFIFKMSKSFFKALFTSVLGGVGAICGVYTLSCFVPLTICFNWLTILIASLFSVPGVIMLLIFNVLLQ